MDPLRGGLKQFDPQERLQAILDHAPALAEFIAANATKLSFKTDADRAATLASVKTYLD